MAKTVPKAKLESWDRQLRKLLNILPWPNGLEAKKVYSRVQDDHDGSFEGEIQVIIGSDGDAWVKTTRPRNGDLIRFRTLFGGTMSPRVRNALMILALAIKLDNEERPIQKPEP